MFGATFCGILSTMSKRGGRRFNTLVPSAYVFWRKTEWKQEITTTYMTLRLDFALLLILGLQNILFSVICSVALLRPEIKENIHCHPASTFVAKATQKAV